MKTSENRGSEFPSSRRDLPDPVSAESYKERMRSIYPSGYLTTISIIQGVALGILATRTYDPRNLDWAHLPFSLVCLVNLMLVFYEYTWFVGVLRWPPSPFATVWPFLLGFTEVGPMFWLTVPGNWWLSMCFFCLVGAIAFGNIYRHCRRSHRAEDDHNAQKVVLNEMRSNLLLSSGGALLCFVTYLLHRYCTMPLFEDYLLLIGLFLLAVGIFVVRETSKVEASTTE